MSTRATSGFDGVAREATIQFNDVNRKLPLLPLDSKVSVTEDFDALLTQQVRNTNHWQDEQFNISTWPALGDYGAVLVEQLREHQYEHYKRLQAENPNAADLQTLASSIEKTVVGVINSAPRRADHYENKANGDEFYVGITERRVEVYAQLPFFRGLHARNLLKEFYRIPNDAGVWPAGEQFRSSIVTQARNFPGKLVKADMNTIPKIQLDGRLAYVDGFGNCRIEVADSRATAKKMVVGKKVVLQLSYMNETYRLKVYVVNKLVEIPENELGIYRNPADPIHQKGPGYIELVRRVSNPNVHYHSAYETLRLCIENYWEAMGEQKVIFPTEWDNINITIDG